MADRRIDQLPGLPAVDMNDADCFPVFDIESGTTYQVSTLVLREFLAANLNIIDYTNYFKGTFANEAAMPASGEADQWLIRSDTDQILVWSANNNEWRATGVTAPVAANAPYTFVYDTSDGSGYGFVDANGFNNTPDGKLQSVSGSFRPVDATVKMATLVNAGDRVVLDGIDFAAFGSYYYRMAFLAARKNASLSWSTQTYNDVGSGTGYYVQSSSQADVFAHNCFVRPYFGTSSYAGGMVAVQSNYVPADNTNVRIEYRLTSTFKLEFLVDDEVVSRSSLSLDGAWGGIDIYILAKNGQIFPQPLGDAPGAPPVPAGDAWSGPHAGGLDFDGVNNRIKLPSLGADATDFRCNDDSAFSVSAEFLFDSSIGKKYSLFGSPEGPFYVMSSTSYYGYQSFYSDIGGLNPYTGVIWYDGYENNYNGSRNSVTHSWAGKASGKACAFSMGSQKWMRTQYKGFYDPTTRVFTHDANGESIWLYGTYQGNGWYFGMNTAGKWTRFLGSEAALQTGGTNSYNQTYINVDSQTVNGQVIPSAADNLTSSWQSWINGNLVGTLSVFTEDDVDDFSGDMFIGNWTVGGVEQYATMHDMFEWTLTSHLTEAGVVNLHDAHNSLDLRTWAADENTAGRPTTLRLYYPMQDTATGSAGDIVDFSTYGQDATSEGF